MVNPKLIKDFFLLLNMNNINYVLIKNDGNKIPYYLEDEKDIDFLIHPTEYENLKKILINNGYEKKIGESCRRFFLYQLREDLFFKKENCYFHFYEALSCNPLTNMGKCKIPLDNIIQDYIWKNKKWDKENNWYIMDDISILLYLIIRSIFDKLDFRIIYIEEIEKRIEYIDSKDFYILANSVFFKFTNKMIELVKKREYKNILKEYLSYKNY
ncbi:hypothetical protein LDK17_05705 [Fusobacterium polymorphum]|uniref:hypothetical protein n=1 Tax=Fusobacterium nucleatum subsp. polymorphum TaxID=76857 RepID=UPI0030CC2372